MKFTECDYNEVIMNKKSDVTKLLCDFRDSQIKCAKIEGWRYCKAQCGASTLNRRAKGLEMPHIKAVVREGDIYLVNTALEVKHEK